MPNGTPPVRTQPPNDFGKSPAAYSLSQFRDAIEQRSAESPTPRRLANTLGPMVAAIKPPSPPRWDERFP